MKKTSIKRLLSILSLLCMQVCAVPALGDQVETANSSTASQLTTMVMSERAPIQIQPRATADYTRMVVNHDNPLFLFHEANFWGKTDGYNAETTWNALPSDIRAYSAIYYDSDTNTKTTDVLMQNYHNLLSHTDKLNIPVFIQIENWNTEVVRSSFTKQQLCELLEAHSSLMGFVHVELSCSLLVPEEIKRIKSTLEVCKEYGALFVWKEMEYSHTTNTVNRAIEDKELYELMKGYAHNVIIVDKHNGQGRHFSTQSSAMGSWLSGICGNWGSNVESWLWWEEGFGNYNDVGLKFRGYSDLFTLKYPPALAGIDNICDMVGGATVYSSEELHLYEPDDETLRFSEAFWSVVYPLYQMVLAGDVPDIGEVKEKIKVAYQFTSADDNVMSGLESDLFIDLYGGPKAWYAAFRRTGTSKKWIPTTGRYYIIPSLNKYDDALSILPHAEILTQSNYKSLVGKNADSKQAYFDAFYPETYTGDATVYHAGGVLYFFNNHENTVSNETIDARQSFSCKLDNGIELESVLREHTYGMVKTTKDAMTLTLTNLRLDTETVCNKLERKERFMDDYMDGKRMDSAQDMRETVIMLSGFSNVPAIEISGTRGTQIVEQSWNAQKGGITLRIISNGVVQIHFDNL